MHAAMTLKDKVKSSFMKRTTSKFWKSDEKEPEFEAHDEKRDR